MTCKFDLSRPHYERIQLTIAFDNHDLFVSTSCLLYEQPIGSRISLYQQHNLNNIELGGMVSVTKNDLSQINLLKANFLIHNYFPPPREAFVLNLASNDDDIRKRSLEMVLKAIDLSSEIGAAFYSIHGGFITDPVSFDGTSFVLPCPESSDAAIRAIDRFVETLKTALEHAEKCKVGILVENNVCSAKHRGKLLLQTAEEFLSLFRLLSSPYLGAVLDTGHLNVSAHTLGFDRIFFVEQMSPYIRAIHIHDNDGTADRHQPIGPNSWVIDVLRRPEFANITLIVEAKFDDMADLSEHVNWLKNEIIRK